METAPLLEVVKDNMQQYGSYVLSNRAIPDLRDGLKPVQRAILVAAHGIGLSSRSGYMKSARITGEVMGKYHPHGDCYGSVVNMAQMEATAPLIDGKGNWGGVAGQDQAAASRYTEARLTPLADSMLDALGLSVVDHVPNYDDTLTLPLVLPAREPVLLYNGAQGIAYGTTTGIPPFERKGVLKLMADTIESGTPPSTKTLVSALKLAYRWGGINATPSADWRSVLETGRGSIKVAPVLHVEGDSIVITETPPHWDWERVAARLLEDQQVKAAIDQTSTVIRYVVQLKRGSSPTEFAETLTTRLTSRVNVALNTVIRKAGSAGAVDTRFLMLTFADFFSYWAQYRVALQKRLTRAELDRANLEMARFDLLLLAVKHLDKLVTLIRRKHADRATLIAAIGKLLGVSAEDATTVLTFTLGRLSSLESGEILASKAALEKTVKRLQADLKRPAIVAAAALRSAA